ncbi:hypothetical protein B0H14DRAFT_2801470 [Mycena olivaceomarginata]|nr:hypothetical protein B0H14DRAFT_2900230 [Mycena olivaceomarginata]KAJ7833115.1 hypothetical protein B0H14DRAFT_2801470 [Mycena olivaceomarginata]
MKSTDFILIIVAILCPPIATFLISGCGCDLLISIGLSILGYLPGHIHAFWLIYRKIKAEEQFGEGGFRYTGYGNFEQAYSVVPAHPPPSYGAAVNGNPNYP